MIENTKVLLENENLHQEQEYYRGAGNKPEGGPEAAPRYE